MTEHDLPARALRFWDLPGAEARLAAQRENMVWRVDSARGRFALRQHRPGLRSVDQIGSELDFMAALARAGLCVPEPLPSASGALWHDLDGTLVDVLGWVPGAMLASDAPRIRRETCFRALGREMARLHRIADGWQVPDGFSRPAWDLDGLTGENRLWGNWQDHPSLADRDRALLAELQSLARRRLQDARPDFGLIHADLVIENVLYDGDQPWLIDFDDFGWGYRLFDLATVIWRAEREPDFGPARDALIGGYLDEHSLDLTLLDTMVALRSLTYLGWIVPRMAEPGATERSVRFVESARRHARNILA